MKTPKRLKYFIWALTLVFLSVGCGSDNTSGESGSTTTTTTVVEPGGVVVTTTNVDQYLAIIGQENPCINNPGAARITAQLPVPGVNANVGSSYIGVSTFGDMAVIENLGNQVVMTMLICPRANLSGSGSVMGNPIINLSQSCPFGEISAANVVLQGEGVEYPVGFAPVHIYATDRQSSLCQAVY